MQQQEYRRKDLVASSLTLLLFFSLSFDSFPLPIRAQIIPLTSILSLFCLPWALIKFQVTPLMKSVFVFIIFAILHSVIALIVRINIGEDYKIMFYSWARQALALLAGFSVFFVSRRILLHVHDRLLLIAVLAGAVLPITMALINILWGFAGSEMAGNFVIWARSLLHLGFYDPYRTTGLSIEPSTFAFYLAVIVIPFALAFIRAGRRRWIASLFFILVAVAFSFTFSGAGFATFAAMCLSAVFFIKKRMLFAGPFLSIVLLITGLLIWVPGNYIVRYRTFLLSRDILGSSSLVDNIYGSVAPFLSAFQSYSLIGYGLGGTATHFEEIVPNVAVRGVITGVRWEDMPNLTSLTSRIFAETGIIGLILFIATIIVGYRQIRFVLKSEKDSLRSVILEGGQLALAGLLVGHAIKFGSFAMPYLWFWLAVVDSRYMIMRRMR